MPEPVVVYFDATGKVAGRLASKIAKELLNGTMIVVFNVEKAIITGRREMVLGEYMRYMHIHSRINPRRHGPFKPKTPEGIFRNMVRGMLPKDRKGGRDAYKRLKTYVSVPERFKDQETVDVPEAKYRTSSHGHVTVGQIARLLGWRPIKEKIMTR